MHTRIAGGCLYHASVALGKPINMTLDVELPIEKYLGHGSNICTLGRQSIYIDSTGNVYPCAFSEGSLLFGNVLKHQFDSIKENFRLFNYRNITCENCIIHRYE